MKKYTYLALLLALLTACSLDKDPISEFNEKNTTSQGNSSSAIETKAQMKARYDAIYAYVRGTAQEFWALDFLQNTETRADNAYAGTSGISITSIEQNSQDASNGNITRDWKRYLEAVNIANVVIANVDKVTDPSLTAAERKQWKAEAKIFRAWMLFDMVRFWGAVPIPALEVPQISSENVEHTYEMLFPSRTSVLDVYNIIRTDLEEALADAPAVKANNKFFFSRGVANALLAHVYAEKPIRDYQKTIQYCTAVEGEGFALLPNYADLFELNDGRTDVKLRNSVESIFEITYSQGGQTWLPGLFGLNHTNPKSTYNWAKWVTPSRDLIAAFDAEGDMVRKNQAIVWGQPSWSIYYPSNNYPFMYKLRSGGSSIIKLRFADILLLKAEAYAALGQTAQAAALVNQVRARVGLAPIASTLSQEQMKEAVLKERRLELAFEGYRWFDLVRNDKAISTMNTLNTRDTGRLRQLYPMTENTLLYPVPQSELENNTKLTQNTGY
jgi:ragB/susD domain protein